MRHFGQLILNGVQDHESLRSVFWTCEPSVKRRDSRLLMGMRDMTWRFGSLWWGLRRGGVQSGLTREIRSSRTFSFPSHNFAPYLFPTTPANLSRSFISHLQSLLSHLCFGQSHSTAHSVLLACSSNVRLSPTTSLSVPAATLQPLPKLTSTSICHPMMKHQQPHHRQLQLLDSIITWNLDLSQTQGPALPVLLLTADHPSAPVTTHQSLTPINSLSYFLKR